MCGCIKIPRLTLHKPYLGVGGEGGEQNTQTMSKIT